MGWTDSFVGFLSASGFGLKVTNLEIIFAKMLFNITRGHGNSLFGEIETIGTMISNKTCLVKRLGGGHSCTSGKSEAGVGFNLHAGGCEWRGWTADTGASSNIGNFKIGTSDFFEIVLGGFFGIKRMIKGCGNFVLIFG